MGLLSISKLLLEHIYNAVIFGKSVWGFLYTLFELALLEGLVSQKLDSLAKLKLRYILMA